MDTEETMEALKVVAETTEVEAVEATGTTIMKGRVKVPLVVSKEGVAITITEEMETTVVDSKEEEGTITTMIEVASTAIADKPIGRGIQISLPTPTILTSTRGNTPLRTKSKIHFSTVTTTEVEEDVEAEVVGEVEEEEEELSKASRKMPKLLEQVAHRISSLIMTREAAEEVVRVVDMEMDTEEVIKVDKIEVKVVANKTDTITKRIDKAIDKEVEEVAEDSMEVESKVTMPARHTLMQEKIQWWKTATWTSSTPRKRKRMPEELKTDLQGSLKKM